MPDPVIEEENARLTLELTRTRKERDQAAELLDQWVRWIEYVNPVALRPTAYLQTKQFQEKIHDRI